VTQHGDDPTRGRESPETPRGAAARARGALARYFGFGPDHADAPRGTGFIVLTTVLPVALFVGVAALVGEGFLVSLVIVLALGIAWGAVLRLLTRTRTD
jgi:hypothetical protein